MAKKAKTRARGKVAKKATKIAEAALPKGFEPVTGYGTNWPGKDAEPGVTLVGTITEFDEVEQRDGRKKRTVQTCKIETKEGQVYTVWESAGLRPLFEYEEGTQVFLRFLGMGEAKRGQNAPRLYQIGVK